MCIVPDVIYIPRSDTFLSVSDTFPEWVTFPEKINTLLAKLFNEGPQDGVGGPIQAQLAYDGALIIEYPDVSRNSVYYALDESGTVLGSLRVDKDSITSFDARGGQGATLKTSGSPGHVSFPSYDLFQRNIF